MPPSHLSVAEAARQLGVHPSRVRALIAAGRLEAAKVGGRWLVDAASVARREQRPTPSGRDLTPQMAWGLLMIAAQREPTWLGQSARSRLRRALRQRGLAGMWFRLGRRATPNPLRAHPSDLERLAKEPRVVLGGISAARHHGVELSAPGQLEVYAPCGGLAALLERHALQRRAPPNLQLHAVDGAWPFAPNERVAPAAVVAVDLLESDEPRTRRAGELLLREVQRQWST